jgi:hypothetical protein
MRLEEAEVLSEYQTRFEKDPRNLSNTYEFFRLLNQHEMYLTLVRLYFKHELDSLKVNSSEVNLIHEQFNFAAD